MMGERLHTGMRIRVRIPVCKVYHEAILAVNQYWRRTLSGPAPRLIGLGRNFGHLGWASALLLHDHWQKGEIGRGRPAGVSKCCNADLGTFHGHLAIGVAVARPAAEG